KKGQAEGTYTKTISSDEYHTFFLKKDKSVKSDPQTESNVIMEDEGSFNEVCNRFAVDKTTEIDVRHLEMPLPMQTILAELKILPDDAALFIHHKRVPIFLLEERAGDNFEVHIHSIEEGNVKMLIFHSKS